jgi:hypothetical protein
MPEPTAVASPAIIGTLAKIAALLRPVRKFWQTVARSFDLASENLQLREETRELACKLDSALKEVDECHAIIRKKEDQINPPRRAPLQEQLLLVAATGCTISAESLTDRFGTHPVESEFHFHELSSTNLVTHFAHDGLKRVLTHQGRAYLVKHELLTQNVDRPKLETHVASQQPLLLQGAPVSSNG